MAWAANRCRGRSSESVHSFFIFNTENVRGPRRTAESVTMLDIEI